MPAPGSRFLFATLVFVVLASLCPAAAPPLPAVQGVTGDLGERSRAVILTDICNEPDDEQSLVRLLLYSNEIDLEGLVATTSCWLRQNPREDVIRRTLAAYGRVRDNLLLHASGYPTLDALSSVTCTGQRLYSMADVGDGKSSAGSRRILAAADKDDPRPLWVLVWGGANTLAQALWDARKDRSTAELTRLVAKLRVYSISDQDEAGPWLRDAFPDLFYVVSPSNPDSLDYHRATWAGISGDRHSKNGPFYRFELVDDPWLDEHVRQNHGPLGALYPRIAFNMEGDTPSFLWLIRNGLAGQLSPDFGGWGGRYVSYRPRGETRPIWTNNRDSRDTVRTPDARTYTSDAATIWRWREAYQYDFAARMDWCVQPRSGANHNPIAVVNGQAGKAPVIIRAKSGERVILSAAGSSDPDGRALKYHWFHYPEAGQNGPAFPPLAIDGADSADASLVAPAVKKPSSTHIILEVTNDGHLPLTAYRRVILQIE